VVLMLQVPTAFGAMLAVAVAAWVPTLVGAVALGHVGRSFRRLGRHNLRILREVGGNSHALLAFFALSNLDVVLARVVFNEHEAGLYAGGLILTKAVLFLPQFVVVVAFPSMASSATRHRMYLRALVVVSFIGLAATAGAAALHSLAVTFIGGPEYAGVEPYIWLFAALGTLLAMIQLMVYEIVARQHRASVYLLWAGLLAVAALAPFVADGRALVIGVGSVYAVVLGVMLVTALLHPVSRERGDEAVPLA
jgi:O-antigen/teichoic acid export membrane protein